MNIINWLSNRELAFLIWAALIVIYLLCKEFGRSFFKSIFKFLFSSAFITLLFFQLIQGALVIWFLALTNFWEQPLIKDLVFWNILVAIPLYYKGVSNTDNFTELTQHVRKNISWSIFLEFILDFWTFSLFIEIIMIPILFFISFISAYIQNKKEYHSLDRVLNWFMSFYIIIVLVHALVKTAFNLSYTFSTFNLKTIFLPVILLITVMPFLYMYVTIADYQSLFVKISAQNADRIKIKKALFNFAGFSFDKISYLEKNIAPFAIHDRSYEDFIPFLNKLIQLWQINPTVRAIDKLDLYEDYFIKR